MTKQMKKAGKMKVSWFGEPEKVQVYESWTGVLCIRKQDIRPTFRGGTGGFCYYKLEKNPKAGPGSSEPKWRTNYGKVYEPPLTREQKKKSKEKKARKQSRREKLLEKLLTHLTKTERKMLYEGKFDFSREELGL